MFITTCFGQIGHFQVIQSYTKYFWRAEVSSLKINEVKFHAFQKQIYLRSVTFSSIYARVHQVASFPRISLSRPRKYLSSSLACCIAQPSVPSRAAHFNNIWLGVQIMKLVTLNFYPVSSFFLHPRPKCLPQRPVSVLPQPAFFPKSDRLL